MCRILPTVMAPRSIKLQAIFNAFLYRELQKTTRIAGFGGVREGPFM